jgi:hypothetical protein
MRLSFASLIVVLSLAVIPVAHASSADSLDLDAAALAQLEVKALHADPREQCFLYTQLVQGYTEVAGKQMAAGDMEQASTTLKRVQGFATHIHMGLAKDTKRLKNAEMSMHQATRHLGQYLHLVSSEDKAVVESTLKQLDKVNEELLAQVFAH